jgi:signal transduction histidine kinase
MDEQARRVLASTSTSVEKLKKLAHELVILSREGILPHQWQDKDLRALLHQARTDSEAAYQQQWIPITIEAPADVFVRVEPAYLLLALGTALRNAQEALAQHTQESEHLRISLSAAVQEQRIVIRVEDTGPGFPAHILSAIQHAAMPGSPPMLFGWSTKPSGVGLGLGLIIQIAQLHGGQAVFGNTATGAYVAFDVPLASTIQVPISMASLATSD